MAKLCCDVTLKRGHGIQTSIAVRLRGQYISGIQRSRRYDNITCTNAYITSLNRIACIPLDFIDGRSGAAAAQGEPKTRT